MAFFTVQRRASMQHVLETLTRQFCCTKISEQQVHYLQNISACPYHALYYYKSSKKTIYIIITNDSALYDCICGMEKYFVGVTQFNKFLMFTHSFNQVYNLAICA